MNHRNDNRARNLKLKLGFPQGQANPTTLARLRTYQKSYRMLHLEQRLKAQRKYTKKFATTSLKRHLFLVEQQTKKLLLKKKRAQDAIKELRQLQAMQSKNRTSRKTTTHIHASRRRHPPKLQRSDDLSRVSQKARNTKDCKKIPKSA